MTAQQSGDAPCLQISTLLCTRRSGRLLCTVFVSGAPSQRPANARQPLLTASAPHTVPTGIRPDPTGCTPPAPALPPGQTPPKTEFDCPRTDRRHAQPARRSVKTATTTQFPSPCISSLISDDVSGYPPTSVSPANGCRSRRCYDGGRPHRSIEAASIQAKRVQVS